MYEVRVKSETKMMLEMLVLRGALRGSKLPYKSAGHKHNQNAAIFWYLCEGRRVHYKLLLEEKNIAILWRL
jgi:hypothetical protein